MVASIYNLSTGEAKEVCPEGRRGRREGVKTVDRHARQVSHPAVASAPGVPLLSVVMPSVRDAQL